MLNGRFRNEAINFKIASRIMYDRAVIGYALIMIQNGDIVDSGVYPKDKIIQFIKAGYISNARVQ